MEVNEFHKIIINRLTKMEMYRAELYLQKLGWNFIGSGAESSVFSKKGVHFVIKIRHRSHSGHSPLAVIAAAHDKLCIPTEAFEANGWTLVVQQKVDVIIDDLDSYRSTCSYLLAYKKRAKHYSFFDDDVISCNLGLFQGRVYSVDWALPAGYFS